jgi:uncharacterized protein (UPF0147 family)
VNIEKMRSAMNEVERLELELAAAKTALTEAISDPDVPICFVPTTAADRVGNRKPRLAKTASTKPVGEPRKPRRVAEESIEAVRAALANGLTNSSAIVEATGLHKPVVLMALAELVSSGVARKVGDKRGASWHLASED